MKSNPLTSESVQNYLKAICELSDGDRTVSAQEIASAVGVSGPSVTKMLKYLAQQQLIVYKSYQPVRLTDVGERIALEVIRHHRLIELYLMERLGYGWEQVHAEAEHLEHHISEEFEDTIERLLGFPTIDPHGDPIPTRDGKMPRPVSTTLESQTVGTTVVVRRVTDENAELLRYLADRGLRPGALVEIVDREPFGGSLLIRVSDHEDRVGVDAARRVFVEPNLR
jgi:DtxR family Mn-dependent transcriptional regulator